MNDKNIVPQDTESAVCDNAKCPDKLALPHVYPDGKIYINPKTPGLFDSASE